jgi:hypothetical protein
MKLGPRGPEFLRRIRGNQESKDVKDCKDDKDKASSSLQALLSLRSFFGVPRYGISGQRFTFSQTKLQSGMPQG